MFAITSRAHATLLAAATAADTQECCGLLLAQAPGEDVIAEARPAVNRAPDPARRFEIDPAALIAAHRAARAGGPRVLGYYHSHPVGSPAPSAEDLASASGDGRIWAIVARTHGAPGWTIGWWRDDPAGFVALPCRVVDR